MLNKITICPRSLVAFYIANLYTSKDKSSWTLNLSSVLYYRISHDDVPTQCSTAYHFVHIQGIWLIHAVCKRSFNPFFMATFYIKWDRNSWTYSICARKDSQVTKCPRPKIYRPYMSQTNIQNIRLQKNLFPTTIRSRIFSSVGLASPPSQRRGEDHQEKPGSGLSDAHNHF